MPKGSRGGGGGQGIEHAIVTVLSSAADNRPPRHLVRESSAPHRLMLLFVDPLRCFVLFCFELISSHLFSPMQLSP